MKKILLTVILIFTTIVAFSQARLGSSASEIKSEFSERRYDLLDYTENNIYYINITTERAIVVYHFSSDMKCILTRIIPDNQGSLNFFVELYNKMYVIISPTKWKMYSGRGIANIELVYPKAGSYYFIWSN